MVQTFEEWEAGTFAVGDRVRYNGILYEARNARTSSDTTIPQDDPTNWKVITVLRIQDYNSLQEAVRLELNEDDDRINSAIPFYIQMAEESFQKRIRAPIQRNTRTLTVDGAGRVTVPQDLQEVINMRIDDDDEGNDLIQDQMRIEILAANSQEEYLRLLRGYDNYRIEIDDYDSGVYWYDSTYFYIAPGLDEGTEIELNYYSVIPQLGTTVNLTDAQGNPINADDQTLAAWVADGNAEADFVQASETVNVNWFITVAPQMILYGALINANRYLRDDARAPIYQAAFESAEAEVMTLIERFENNRPQFISESIPNTI